jgi:hypothetical protein
MIEKVAEFFATLIFKLYVSIRGQRLKTNRKNGALIRSALSDVCKASGCDNALLFEYTNGETSINGRSFYYVVTHHEGRKMEGTPSRIFAYEGKTPVSVINFIDTQTELGLFRYKSAGEIPDAVTRAWLSRAGVRSVVTVPLYNQSKKYIAFVMLMWCDSVAKNPEELGFKSSEEAYEYLKRDLGTISTLI